VMERSGLRPYVDGRPGFYVVNGQTNIAVARCESARAAEREAMRRDQMPPATEVMVVIEVRP